MHLLIFRNLVILAPMMWFQQEQHMVNLHKLRVQPLRLMQVAPIRLLQRLQELIPIQYLYVHRVKQPIVLHKL